MHNSSFLTSFSKINYAVKNSDRAQKYAMHWGIILKTDST